MRGSSALASILSVCLMFVAYGTARAHATLLGFNKIARLLQQTLNEETATDKKLTQLAESIINAEAVEA